MLGDVIDEVTEVAIIAIDPQGVITLFNRGAELFLGYSGRWLRTSHVGYALRTF
jgi:PAS domain S-box-containing protein